MCKASFSKFGLLAGLLVGSAAAYAAEVPVVIGVDGPRGTQIDVLSGTQNGTNALNEIRFVTDYRTAVYRDPITQELDFVYQFFIQPGASTGVNRLSAGDFRQYFTGLFQTASDIDGVNGTLPGAFVAGQQAATTGTSDMGGTSNIVGFNFQSGGLGQVDANESSYTLVVRTNATQYGAGFFQIIDGGTANILGFAPVPEPGFYIAPLAMGMAGLVVIARRRKLVAQQ